MTAIVLNVLHTLTCLILRQPYEVGAIVISHFIGKEPKELKG